MNEVSIRLFPWNAHGTIECDVVDNKIHTYMAHYRCVYIGMVSGNKFTNRYPLRQLDNTHEIFAFTVAHHIIRGAVALLEPCPHQLNFH